MFNRKEAKKNAKAKLRKHYWIFLLACLLASFFGIEYTFSLGPINTVVTEAPSIVEDIRNGGTPLNYLKLNNYRAFGVFKEIISGNAEKGREMSEHYIEENKNSSSVHLKYVELGYKDGVFAEIANSVSSGSPIVTVFFGISSIVGNSGLANAIFIALSLMLILFIWGIAVNTYRAVYRRIFLEGYIYGKIPIKTFLHFIHVRKYLKASLTMLVTTLLRLAWMLTVVGGCIKYFSYYMVPYIVAENPDISPMKAIRLSRDMMKGHKLECLKLKLSFFGWYMAELLTLGAVGVFFANPYQETVFLEYYVYLRGLAKENRIENAELLNDGYLYEKMDREELLTLYSDYAELTGSSEADVPEVNRVWKFFAEVFGLVPVYSETERKYFDYQLRKVKTVSYNKIINGESYPDRANPIPEKQKEKRAEYIRYNRHYSLCSLILIFFLFSFFGWFWEVCFHLVTEARFVNRGVLHGPWTPIYGAGGIMILLLLYKLRSRPVISFLVSVALCGVVEYFTGVVLECLYGERWWDYTGYFLNINGRVCAEGLLVFGIAGILVVYLIAPFTDNVLRRIKLRYLLTLCVLLMTMFICDIVYSAAYPNSGEGINDFKYVIGQDERSE